MSENEIMKLMSVINYGWIDKNGAKHINDFKTFADEYILQSPEEVIKNKIGVCWDQVELERKYFEQYKSVKTFFIVHYDNNQCPTHTFLTFEKNNKCYWFEHSWECFRGIHEYSSVEELLTDIKNKFIKIELNNIYDKDRIVIYEYSKPEYNISVQEFFDHCSNGKFIELEKLSEGTKNY